MKKNISMTVLFIVVLSAIAGVHVLSSTKQKKAPLSGFSESIHEYNGFETGTIINTMIIDDAKNEQTTSIEIQSEFEKAIKPKPSSIAYTSYYQVKQIAKQDIEVYLKINTARNLVSAEIRGLSPKQSISFGNKNNTVLADWSGQIIFSQIIIEDNICAYLNNAQQSICHAPRYKEENNNA